MAFRFQRAAAALAVAILFPLAFAAPVSARESGGHGTGTKAASGKSGAHDSGATHGAEHETEDEDPAVALRRQVIPETADEIARLFLSRNEDLLRLQGCRKRGDCSDGTQKAMVIRLEQAKELLDALEARARKRKDLRSALWRGRFAFDAASQMAATALDSTDPQYRDVAVQLRERASREYGVAAKWLAAPAGAGDPDACWYLGRVWSEGLGSEREPALAAKLFRCAALGYRVRGDLTAAVHSFQRMTKLIDPRHPMATEVYARVWADDKRTAGAKKQHGGHSEH